MNNTTYPLYEVPYLVRDPNEHYMSAERHNMEVRYQAVVDDYFIARDKGLTARKARRHVATLHNLLPADVRYILKWFYQEAKNRQKYDFLEKFAHW